MVIDVQVLYSAGCANTPQAVQRIRDVARGLGIPVRITETMVTSQDQAEELRFLGSPTVQIGGQDIDPAARSASAFGFA